MSGQTALRVQPGTLVELYLGDCLEVMPTLPAQIAAMVFADLPYGTKGRKVTANTWDIPFDLSQFWPALKRARGLNCVCILTAKQPFCADAINSNRAEFRYDCVYVKSRPTRHHHAHRMPLCAHEHLLVFGRGKMTYNPIKTPRDKVIIRSGASASANYSEPNVNSYNGRVYTDRFPTSVLQIKAEQQTAHPTQKPVALLERLIKTYTNPGDTVIDPVMGSGTAGVACKRLGRHFIGIEKDPTYFAAAKARIEAEP